MHYFGEKFFSPFSEISLLFTNTHDSKSILLSFIYSRLFINYIHFVRQITEVLFCNLKNLRISEGNNGRAGKTSVKTVYIFSLS